VSPKVADPGARKTTDQIFDIDIPGSSEIVADRLGLDPAEAGHGMYISTFVVNKLNIHDHSPDLGKFTGDVAGLQLQVSFDI
jgi:hypothetical protein